MKKYYLIALVLFWLCFGFIQQQHLAVIGKKLTAAECTKDTSNLIMDITDEDAYTSPSTENALGQSVSFGSQWSLYSIKIKWAVGSSCSAEVRIGTSKDLSSYTENWTGITPGNGGEAIELISVDNDVYSSSTPYYIGFKVESGACSVYQDSASGYASGTKVYSSSGWQLGADDTVRDFSLQVYQCQ